MLFNSPPPRVCGCAKCNRQCEDVSQSIWSYSFLALHISRFLNFQRKYYLIYFVFCIFVSVAFYCLFQLLAPLLTALKLQDLLAAVSQSVCLFVCLLEWRTK